MGALAVSFDFSCLSSFIKAKQLLADTKYVMVKGYSKLFIYDIVLPPTRASISQATMDMKTTS